MVASGGAFAWGAYERNSPLFGRVIRRLPTDAPFVALTFDDGPNPNATPAILDTLGAHGVLATFFVLGKHADRWPQLVARMAAEGHVVANHGFHHQKLLWHSPRWIRRDLRLGREAIERCGADRPVLFRAPHGQRNPWVTPIARSEGQRTVGWTLGVWDSAKPGVTEIAARVIRRVRCGSIVLLHDGDGYDPHGDRMQTAAALPTIIRGLHERAFTFVALAA
jgi:peptidoglycan/xylan/chitin deacetylase (PgdA/CDA1 family)